MSPPVGLAFGAMGKMGSVPDAAAGGPGVGVDNWILEESTDAWQLEESTDVWLLE